MVILSYFSVFPTCQFEILEICPFKNFRKEKWKDAECWCVLTTIYPLCLRHINISLFLVVLVISQNTIFDIKWDSVENLIFFKFKIVFHRYSFIFWISKDFLRVKCHHWLTSSCSKAPYCPKCPIFCPVLWRSDFLLLQREMHISYSILFIYSFI